MENKEELNVTEAATEEVKAEETKEAEPSETPAPTEVDKEGNGWHHCGADAAADDGLETYTPVISK